MGYLVAIEVAVVVNVVGAMVTEFATVHRVDNQRGAVLEPEIDTVAGVLGFEGSTVHAERRILVLPGEVILALRNKTSVHFRLHNLFVTGCQTQKSNCEK